MRPAGSGGTAVSMIPSEAEMALESMRSCRAALNMIRRAVEDLGVGLVKNEE